jgi:hypothetical protein
MNTTLKSDRLLTNQARFGSLAIKRQLVLETWSSTLLDDDFLPDHWTRSEGILVGIRPVALKAACNYPTNIKSNQIKSNSKKWSRLTCQPESHTKA